MKQKRTGPGICQGFEKRVEVPNHGNRRPFVLHPRINNFEHFFSDFPNFFVFLTSTNSQDLDPVRIGVQIPGIGGGRAYKFLGFGSRLGEGKGEGKPRCSNTPQDPGGVGGFDFDFPKLGFMMERRFLDICFTFSCFRLGSLRSLAHFFFVRSIFKMRKNFHFLKFALKIQAMRCNNIHVKIGRTGTTFWSVWCCL